MTDEARKETISIANVVERYLEESHLERLDIPEPRAGKLRAELESVAMELREAALGR